MNCTHWDWATEAGVGLHVVYIPGKQCGKDASWAIGNGMFRCEAHAEYLLKNIQVEEIAAHAQDWSLAQRLNIRRIKEMA